MSHLNTLPTKCADVFLVNPDKASTLLEGFWTKPFDLLELLPIDKRSSLFSPFDNILGPIGIQSSNMPKK